MADIMTGADFRRHLKMRPNGIYLFFGEEEYTKHRALADLRQLLCADEQTAVFNHTRLSAADADFSLSALTDAYTALPFFGGDKLTELHDLDCNALRDGEKKKLLSLLTSLPVMRDDAQNVLVIYCLPSELDGGQPNRPTAFLKQLCEVCTPVRFDRESPAALLSWTQKHFTAERILSSPEICKLLCVRCGYSMFAIDNEVRKIAAYLHANQRERVERDDLDLLAPVTPDIGAFDFTNALLNCDPDGVYTVYADMKNRRERPELILGTVISVYDTLYRVKLALEEGRSVSEIASLYRQNEKRMAIYARAGRAFSLRRLQQAIRACAETDLRLKTSAAEPYTAIEILLATLTVRRAR